MGLTNMSAAEKEIKASQAQNKALQNLKRCPMLGGRVQILIGIKYNSIFPILVHSLPNGLTIYRLQTSSHSKHFTAAIGGPHESFNQTMADNANLSGFTHLFVNLRERMNDFRMLETSTLSCSVMTMKEEVFAVKHNEFGVPELDEVNVEHIVNCAEDEEEENSEIETAENDLFCGECGENLCLSNLTDKEEDDLIKAFEKSQDKGLRIDYHCPRCRECKDCRRSHETERISL